LSTETRDRPGVALRVLADLVRLAGLASLVGACLAGQWVNAALFSLVLLGLVLPRILATAPLLDLVYGSVLLFAAWSAVLDFYVRYDWLDVLVHAVACGLTAFVAHRLLVGVGVLPPPASAAVRHPGVGTVVGTTSLGLALGVLWEMGEYVGHTYLDHRIQVGYGDTMGDLMADGVGALVAALVLLRSRDRAVEGAADLLSVSVVIPVKDDAPALERCLELLAQQTVAPQEVVVVDNGSVDDSAEVARRYGARVVPEPRPGIPAAAATGYDAACSEVIARCDADTVPPVDWVHRIAATMTADAGLDALTGTGRFYDLPRWSTSVVSPLYLGSYYLLVLAALGHLPVWGSNMAIRRRTWQEVRHLVHLDAELHDDIDLSFVLGPGRRIGYDRRLVVGVSARSLRGREQVRRRFRRALSTMEVNWRVMPPWVRWQSRFRPQRADG
jgi:hypothetical protein